MNGLDFLDKINDLDDDLLVLEKPAKVTNLRLRTTIISLAAAAGVFLIIGSIILVPHFMNKGSNAISTVRSGGSDDGGKKSIYAEAAEQSEDNGADYEATTVSFEETQADFEDYEDEDSSFEQDSEQASDQASQQQGCEQDSSDKNTDSLYKGDVAIVNNDNNFTDDEGYDYLAEIYENISGTGYTFGDPSSYDFSVDGFCYLDITNDPMIDVGYKYYIEYKEDSINSIIGVAKNDNDYKYQINIYLWLDDLYDFFEEHKGQDVVFVKDGEDIYCIAPDNTYFSSDATGHLSGSNLYSLYKYEENTYHID